MFGCDIKKILIFTSAFGLLGIILCIAFFESSEVLISALVMPNAKERVYIISGNIKNTEIKSNTLFFSLCDSFSCIDCVYFNPSSGINEKIENSKNYNHLIKVKARFEYYYGRPELVVYKFYFKDQGGFS